MDANQIKFTKTNSDEFYKTLRKRVNQYFKDKDVFVEPLSYKSYAHLFYTNKIKSTKDAFDTLGQSGYWTPNGNIQRPSYFICKIILYYLINCKSIC